MRINYLSPLVIFIQFIFATLIIFFIRQIPDSHIWIRAGLTMLWGTVFLIELFKIISERTEYSFLGIYVVFYVGAVLCFLFIVWLLNVALMAFNPILLDLNLNFQIGKLFHGIHSYIFSFPALACGAILIIRALSWAERPHYLFWKYFFLYGN